MLVLFASLLFVLTMVNVVVANLSKEDQRKFDFFMEQGRMYREEGDMEAAARTFHEAVHVYTHAIRRPYEKFASLNSLGKTLLDQLNSPLEPPRSFHEQEMKQAAAVQAAFDSFSASIPEPGH